MVKREKNVKNEARCNNMCNAIVISHIYRYYGGGRIRIRMRAIAIKNACARDV